MSGEFTGRDDAALVDDLERRVSDVQTLYDLAREEGDESVEPEIVGELDGVSLLTLDKLELRALFTGEHDERDAICEVHSGAGGTDAQDWTEMLLRMFTRWAEPKGFDVELDETQEGQEAGITSATFIIKGRYAYGMLAGERGVHRLIRISPFDANRASDRVRVVRLRTRARGDRRTGDREHRPPDRHLPVVGRRRPARQRHRFGGAHHAPAHRRRRVVPERAVTDAEQGQGDADPRRPPGRSAREEHRKEFEALSGDKRDVAFGNQIRTYTLAPYQLVKDERTRYETGNVQAVLDGDLDPFIEAYLQWRRRGQELR